MERLHKAMVAYIRAMSKRNEGDDKEKILPVGYLGGTMVMHGEDFENNSEFGQCLIGELALSISLEGERCELTIFLFFLS